MCNAMTTRPHVVPTAWPQLHSTATQYGVGIRPPHPRPSGGTRVDSRFFAYSARPVSYPQIRRTIFRRERLRTRKDASGAVRTP